jgi:hypothetical protein
MKRVASHLIGVDQGETILFSDYEDNGEMWTGQGVRERRVTVKFSEPYRSAPMVHVNMSLLDMATGPSVRADLTAQNITPTSFEIVFCTWEDSRVARIRAAWISIGELIEDEQWQLY